jgi:RHS repeat-associated protein
MVGYDLQYRVTSVQTGTIQDLTYVSDSNGNVQDIVNNLDSSENKSFSYDSTNRLDAATGPWGNLSWTYDDVGNRLTYTDGSGTTNYGYSTGTNRLQALTGATTKTFSYSNVGNIETEDTRQYVYNENNRLIQVSDGGVVGDYTYTGHGERVIKTVQGATTVFLYDESGTLVGESDGVNLEEYIYLGSTPIAKASGQDLFFIHPDHLDTPRMMTDGGGASAWNLEARPFGDSENATGSETLNSRFPGQYYDEETGLHYNYFRDYKPLIGRYIQSDPIGLDGGLNIYEYAAQNPLVVIDPMGLDILVCTRKTDWKLGNHAYMWDTRPRGGYGNPPQTMPRSCGTGDNRGKEKGPKFDHCLRVKRSRGKESEIMACCLKDFMEIKWYDYGYSNNCHTKARQCIEKAGAEWPGAPGGMFGGPPCDDDKCPKHR